MRESHQKKYMWRDSSAYKERLEQGNQEHFGIRISSISKRWAMRCEINQSHRSMSLEFGEN